MIKIKMTTNFKSDLETFAPLFVHSVCQFDFEKVCCVKVQIEYMLFAYFWSSLSSPNLPNITHQIKRRLTLASCRSLNINKSCPVRVFICGCFWINLQSPFLWPVNFGVFITTFLSLFPFAETVEWVYITPGLVLKLFKKAC